MSALDEPVAPVTRVVPLTDLVELNPRPDRAALRDDLEVSFVPMAAVEAGSGCMDATGVRRFGEVKKGYTTFRDGDVLFAKITPCMENGKMVVARDLRNGIGCGSTEFHVLRPRPGVDAHYVYHFVSSARFRAEAAHHMTGAVGQKRVPTAFLEQCLIPLPNLDEQRRIVAELEKQFSRLDEAVANLKRVKAKLERHRAAMLAQVTTGLGICLSTEEPASTYLDDVGQDLDVPLPALPQHWKWTTVGMVGSVRGGKRLPLGHKYAAERTPYPYLRVTDFVEFGIDDSSLQYLYAATRREIERYTISSKDVYISIAGSIGLVGQVPAHLDNANLTENAAKITELQGVEPRFLIYWLASPTGRRLIAKSTIATTQSKLALFRIEKLPVPIAPIDEQRRIVAEVDRRLSIVREVEAEVDANLKRAQALRQAVLANAFSFRSGTGGHA